MINQCLELNMKMKENTALNKSHALLKEIERAHNNFNNRTVHLNPNDRRTKIEAINLDKC